MKLLLISLNYSPELTGIGKYNGEMAERLQKNGVEVGAIVAPPYYPEWEVDQQYKSYMYKKEFVNGVSIIRCPLYVPGKLNTLKRLIHLSTFAVSSSIALLIKFIKNKPDVIFLVQPTLFCAPSTLLLSKLFRVKTVMHIQDFEIDAMFGLGMVSGERITRTVRRIESWLMKKFDVVSSISYSMLENAEYKGVNKSKLLFFPNWADTNFVTPETDGSALRKEWGFTQTDKIVLYAGNIGQKQGLEIVIEAAKSFEDDKFVKFVFVGAGAYVDTLKELAKASNLDNVYFKPLQDWENVPAMLSMADVHLVVQRKGAADAVLPSKLTNILSAGGDAIVTAEVTTELGKIEQANPGIYTRVGPENTKEFVAGLKTVLATDTSKPNMIARNYAVKNLDGNNIIERFASDIDKVVKGKDND
ncbi:colanic acid biosynthesis glycosyltransferase WcaI [Pseudoalteromonas sp. HM-SA03]|uniref:WcaI family glycosyltransferase n=1 Tax=Pseudoalteromonas sp. HM-SA03 TaxID=2029678 RepID=UPI000BAE49E2|nr:WcaI family glycosyltransferase [Pseudoalteromonas sp. HM-SA03]PAY00661.1 colanic acid biosynthesis glycosyltransferase WcaI [Pseudoalteromonas sp. HM-SA03]